MRFQFLGKFIALLFITSTVFLVCCDGPANESDENEKSVEVSIAEMEKEFFSETQTKLCVYTFTRYIKILAFNNFHLRGKTNAIFLYVLCLLNIS
mgnify:CR=1 FL=1